MWCGSWMSRTELIKVRLFPLLTPLPLTRCPMAHACSKVYEAIPVPEILSFSIPLATILLSLILPLSRLANPTLDTTHVAQRRQPPPCRITSSSGPSPLAPRPTPTSLYRTRTTGRCRAHKTRLRPLSVSCPRLNGRRSAPGNTDSWKE